MEKPQSDSNIKRRTFLRYLGSIPLLSAIWSYLTPSVRAGAPGTTTSARRVRPTDPSWPTAASWEKLNQQVGGQLIPVTSPLAPCQDAPGSAACEACVQEMKNPYFIGDQAGGTQTSGWLGGWTSKPSVYKKKYDPSGLFFVHHGVGSEEWSPDGFTKLAGS